jgi:hypothetical protein
MKKMYSRRKWLFSGAAVLATATHVAFVTAGVPESLDGAVCFVEKTNLTIRVVPWEKETTKWDWQNIRTFKSTLHTIISQTPHTIIHGDKVTVGDLIAGRAVVKSIHFKRLTIKNGKSEMAGTSLEIKDFSQLLHRRVSLSRTETAQTLKLATTRLPVLLARESMAGLLGNSGGRTFGSNDDVQVDCGAE